MKIPELLSPVGDFDCLVAAVQNGADAVYFGSSFFNARQSATNFDIESIEKAIDYAKLRGVKTHLTLNTLIKDNEFEKAAELANKVYSYGIDAIIVQDLGLARFLIKNFPDLAIHASTQMTFHNLSGVLQAEELGFKRVVLSREVPISEIKKIRANSQIELEAFIHGALCISYSGQCLFSSMVGGRSGNRGKCAQACRLPYELLKDSKAIEKGYLLSPKDVCSITVIPEFIKSGVDSFKIEGRMKTPEYVATVTQIYRKYIDLFKNKDNYTISDDDINNLMQVFNRGGFSTGHLKDNPNSNLIYKEKSNNQGIYLGTILSFSPVSGHIKVKIEAPLSIGDTISIDSETGSYNVSEIMQKNINLRNAQIGQIITIGRMKGDIKIGEKIYKMSSKSLSDSAKQTFSGKEFKKIPLNAKLIVNKNKPLTMEIKTKDNICVRVQSDLVPETALSSPITKDRILEQISKTGNTPFEFSNIEIDLGSNLYIPSIGKLNELRRIALNKITNEIQKSYKKEPIKLSFLEVSSKKNVPNYELSILLNHINDEEDYSYLKKAKRIYIPYSCFISNSSTLHTICSNNSVYLYLPCIIQNANEEKFKTSILNIFNNFNIRGTVISNISELSMIPHDKEIIANYNLNIFNNNSVIELKNLGFSSFTVSPELNEKEITNLVSISQLPSEVLVYGKLPLMTMQYCMLSHSNHCPKNCNQMCQKNKYELSDRLNFKFEIEQDRNQTITTIYNSKITFIECKNLSCDYVRISFLNESESEKNKIIDLVLQGKRMEGNNYTNSNFSREV